MSDFVRFCQFLTKNDYDNTGNPRLCYQLLSDVGEGVWKYFFFNIEEVEEVEEKLTRHNIDDKRYVSIALASFSQDRKITKYVNKVRVLCLDIDTYLDNVIIQQLRDKLKPNSIVITSTDDNNKYKSHFYFRIGREDVEEDEKDVQKFYIDNYTYIQKSISEATAGIISCILEEHNIHDVHVHVDHSIGISKGMRSPGFLHQKNPESVYMTSYIEYEDEADVYKKDIHEFLGRFNIDVDYVREVKSRSNNRSRAIGDYEDGDFGYPVTKEGERHTTMYAWVMGVADRFRLRKEWVEVLAQECNSRCNCPALESEEVGDIVNDVYEKLEHRRSEALNESVRLGNAVAVAKIIDDRAKLAKAGKPVDDGGEDVNKIIRDLDKYDYGHVDYEHALSDVSIRRRVWDAYGHSIGHSVATGLMAYNKRVGVWDTDLGKKIAWRRVSQVINNLKHEDVVTSMFTNDLNLNKAISSKLKVGNVNSITNSIGNDPIFHIDHSILDSKIELLNTVNGVVDLTSGKLRGHDSKLMFTGITRGNVNTHRVTELVEGSGSHKWDNLLNTYCGGDEELVRFLQVLLGMSLMGEVSVQIMPLFLGEGANGKSTLLEIVGWVLGSFAGVAPKSMILVEKHGKQNQYYDKLAQLRNARYVVVEDMSSEDKLDYSVIKNLTNGGDITARMLNESNFEFKVKFQMFLQSNYKPKLESADHGILRRMLFVRFDYRVPTHKQKGNFKHVLCADQDLVDYVMDWLVAGSVIYNKEGLRIPASINVLMQNYTNDMIPLEQFLENNFEVELDKTRAMYITDLFDLWMYYISIHEPNSTTLPKESKYFGKAIKSKIERVFNIHYDHTSFRRSDGRLVPLRAKDNEFIANSREELTEDRLKLIKQEFGSNLVSFSR